MKDLYALFRQSLAGLRLMIAATLILGLAYPARRLRLRPGRRAVEGGRLAGHRRRQPHDRPEEGGRLGDHRPAGRRPRPVPAATLGGRRRLRHALDVRLQLRARGARPHRGDQGAQGRDRRARGRRPRATCRRTRSPRPARASTPTSRWRTPTSRCRGSPRRTGSARTRSATWSTSNTSGRTWGVLGEPHVNVLMLNIAVREAAAGRLRTHNGSRGRDAEGG